MLKVFDANAQITKIQIYKKGASSSTKTDTKVSFGENSGKTFTFTEGEYTNGTFTTPTATETTSVAGTVAYSSSNATAISVDASTGALTFPGYGTATITATFTPNDTEKYAESTDSYIVVNKHDVGDAVFYESFDKCDGVGGNDNRYSGTLTTKPALSPEYGDNSGWKFTTGYIANKCVRFGTSSYKGSATTPSITLTGKSILSFKAAAWKNKDDKTNITVSVSDGATLTYNGKTGSSITVDINRGAWTDIDNIEISGAKTFTITFAGNGGNNRFFLDEVMVKNVSESGETTAITLDENSESNTIEAKAGVNVTLKRTMVKGEWNTICLPFEVSEKQAKDAFGEGVKIATLNKKSTGTTISFEDISILGIPASEPCLIKPSIDYPAEGYVFKDVTIEKGAIVPMEDSTDDSSFGFVGIYNKTDISTGIEKTIFMGEFYAAFLGAGNKIYKTDGSGNKTKGFRAYFAIPNGAAASALRVVIDGTATSIKNIDSEVVESNAPVYNLQGQRVNGNNLTPGIYVKAGKKFVVK
ncbi:hypothetical protein [Prevotella merdae]|uniref:hypothetical protein n=1 Tax=Prevotella merdae TaxID=2079531 RepID=UPI003F81D6F9